MNLNSQYIVLFKNPRDRQQVAVLARQMYPNKANYFLNKFEKGTSRPYGYLLVDLKQDTPESDRLKTDIFENVRGQVGLKPFECDTIKSKTVF